jgi:hypothetical protein
MIDCGAKTQLVRAVAPSTATVVRSDLVMARTLMTDLPA